MHSSPEDRHIGQLESYLAIAKRALNCVLDQTDIEDAWNVAEDALEILDEMED